MFEKRNYIVERRYTSTYVLLWELAELVVMMLTKRALITPYLDIIKFTLALLRLVNNIMMIWTIS